MILVPIAVLSRVAYLHYRRIETSSIPFIFAYCKQREPIGLTYAIAVGITTHESSLRLRIKYTTTLQTRVFLLKFSVSRPSLYPRGILLAAYVLKGGKLSLYDLLQYVDYMFFPSERYPQKFFSPDCSHEY